MQLILNGRHLRRPPPSDSPEAEGDVSDTERMRVVGAEGEGGVAELTVLVKGRASPSPVERTLRPARGRRPIRPPAASKGSGRSHAPRSAASAAWKLAVASAARLRPPRSLRRPSFLTSEHPSPQLLSQLRF